LLATHPAVLGFHEVAKYLSLASQAFEVIGFDVNRTAREKRALIFRKA
jgi:hypothetical protein